MTPLSDRERELVAVGAAIGAGCQPCTEYHVPRALKSGLSAADVERAMQEAADVRERGAQALLATGRRALGLDGREPAAPILPADLPQALAWIGAAGGCNSGALLVSYVAAGRRLGLSAEQVREALGVTRAVKKAAAGFLEQAIDEALADPCGEAACQDPANCDPQSSCSPESSCCGPGR